MCMNLVYSRGSQCVDYVPRGKRGEGGEDVWEILQQAYHTMYVLNMVIFFISPKKYTVEGS